LSGRGLCDELITRPEESYRMCCVVVCNLETSRMGSPYIYDISRLRVNIIFSSMLRSSKLSLPFMFSHRIPVLPALSLSQPTCHHWMIINNHGRMWKGAIMFSFTVPHWQFLHWPWNTNKTINFIILYSVDRASRYNPCKITNLTHNSFFIYVLFLFSTCFGHLRAHHQEN